MEPGYEIEPEPIGRATDRRRPAVAIAIALIVVGVALAKPWDGRSAPLAALPTPEPSAPVALAIPAPRVLAARTDPTAADPDAVPTWPSARTPSLLATRTAREAERAIGQLASHAGTWGIGTAGVGPRMLRDEPWSDWTPATVEIADGAPLNIAMWPGTGLCAGYPAIYDRPTLVAVTTPHDIAPDRVFRGWWTDGAKVAALEGSVVQTSPPGNRGIGYLERLDQAPWPPGRYEFHVVAGESSVSLTVCLTRRG